MRYVDIHCHLPARTTEKDEIVQSGGDFINQGNLDEILARMKENGVGAITISADWGSSKRAVQIAEANENIWATIGVHCEGIFEKSQDFKKEIQNELSELVKSPKVVGIGECGLEYFFMDREKTGDLQKKLFESQIEFALEHNKPLMLHLRPSKKSFDAYFDAIQILSEYKNEEGDKLRGNVHFFAGDTEVARKFLDLGFTISLTGVITFARDYDEVIKYVPQDSIMSETDAPFVSPVPYRGKRNEPSYVVEVVKKMAQIREEDLGEFESAVLDNFKRVFGPKNLE